MAALADITERQMIGTYYAALEGVTLPSWVGMLANEFTSDQAQEEYKWLGMAPAMREKKGALQPTRPRAQGITIQNVEYEASEAFPNEIIRRDKTGQVQGRIADLARRSVQHWKKLLSTLLENGTSTNCYDGQYFFDTDHLEGSSGTQNNAVTATEVTELNVTTAAAPTPNEMSGAIMGMIEHLMTFKDDQGEPLNDDAEGFLVMVPKTFMGSTYAAITSQQLDTGSGGTRDNPLKAMMGHGMSITPVVNPRLTWTTDFAVFRTDARVKPLIRQSEVGTDTFWVLDGSSEYSKTTSHWLAAAEASRGAGYGMWQYAIKGTLS